MPTIFTLWLVHEILLSQLFNYFYGSTVFLEVHENIDQGWQTSYSIYISFHILHLIYNLSSHIIVQRNSIL